MKAKILERTVNEETTLLTCEIFTDDNTSMGVVSVTDGNERDVRAALRAEAARLQTLPVGMELEL